ncbi:MAG: efflux RND transporter periplasmic adaptor subunit [Gelidibacter sp.]
MKTKRIITIIVILLIPIAIIFGLLKNKKTLDDNKKPVDRSDIPVNVAIDTVSYKAFVNNFSSAATLKSNEDATISAESSGKIVSLNIELGTKVSKGQIIGRIDITDKQQELEATNLSIKKLEDDYKRNKILVEGNATNANAVTDTKYELDAKKIEASQLKTEISKANIKAPISGIITEKDKVVGEYVSAGGTLGAIADVSKLKAEVYVPESLVFNIEKGQTVKVTSDVFSKEIFTAAITFISPKADENHNYLVELTLKNTNGKQLKSGMYVKVEFPGNSTNQELLMIPKSALTEGVKNPYVYVYNNGVAEERQLTLGADNGIYVEVNSGLKAGELVITSGQINLIDGTKVNIVQLK